VLHPTDPVLTAAFPYPEARCMHERLQTAITASRSAPYRHIALAVGIGWVALLALTAGLLRVLRLAQPDRVDQALAAAYYNVPEMALHKKIELAAFLRSAISGNVVDLGCGSGIVGGILAANSRIARLHGVDSNGNLADLAKQNGYAEFTASDLARIPLPDAQFDAAISICVLEHVEDLAGALREAHRILKPGGRLFFSTVGLHFHEGLIGYRLRRAVGRLGAAREFARRRDLVSMHMHFLGTEEWVRVLHRLRFTQISVEPIFSRGQLLIYDAMNFSVYFPKFFFCDKLQVFAAQHPWFKRLAISATAAVTAFLGRGTVTADNCTHWFVSATLPRA
jgi:ubiquinone/menaquinone biosynthesis C-methylase UbiE